MIDAPEIVCEEEIEYIEETRKELFSYEMPRNRYGTDNGDACEGADDIIIEDV